MLSGSYFNVNSIPQTLEVRFRHMLERHADVRGCKNRHFWETRTQINGMTKKSQKMEIQIVKFSHSCKNVWRIWGKAQPCKKSFSLLFSCSCRRKNSKALICFCDSHIFSSPFKSSHIFSCIIHGGGLHRPPAVLTTGERYRPRQQNSCRFTRRSPSNRCYRNCWYVAMISSICVWNTIILFRISYF